MTSVGRVPSLSFHPRIAPGALIVPTDRLIRWSLPSVVSTSFFVTLFSSIPGLLFLHHVFAFCFAASAATWCTCTTMFSHACAQADQGNARSVWRRIRVKYALCAIQIGSWTGFGVLWILLKLGWPSPFIPNRDGRFVFLALFEYAATAALIVFIHLTAQDLAPHPVRVSLSSDSSGEKGV
jgi:hypothetical protein